MTEAHVISRRSGRLVNGRYRLLSMIGSGGMGHVWLAEDEVLGRRVALKELILAPNGEPLSVRHQRVRREARAAARIRHPGIVEVHDMFMEDDVSWIVMAYVRGRSLQDLIEHGPLGERRIAEIGRRVLDALIAAHRVGVMHRDVKPANILVAEGGEVFLVDFGIAHIVGESRLTSQNAFAGTLEYMAPERIDGLPPEPSADLWSLGATLFHALEGRSPFFRGNVPATMKAITLDAPPRVTRAGPLSDAIAGLLRKDPGRRTDARGLEGVLRSIVAGPPPHRPGPASAPSSPGRSRSPSLRPSPSPPPTLSPRAAERTPERVVDLGGLAPAEVARVVSAMAAPSAARLLARLPAEVVQRVLVRTEPDVVGAILLEVSAERAASFLDAVPARTAGAALNVMAARRRETAAVLRAMGTARAGQALSHIDPGQGGALLGSIPPGEAAKILACTAARATAGIVRVLAAAPLAVRLIETMPTRRACGVLDHVPPVIIAHLLEASSDGRADRLLGGLDEAVRAQVLRHLRAPGKSPGTPTAGRPPGRARRSGEGPSWPENPGGGRK